MLKCPINPVTNPKPVHSHTLPRDNILVNMVTTNPLMNCITITSLWYKLLLSWVGYRHSADKEVVLCYGTQIFISMLPKDHFWIHAEPVQPHWHLPPCVHWMRPTAGLNVRRIKQKQRNGRPNTITIHLIIVLINLIETVVSLFLREPFPVAEVRSVEWDKMIMSAL
jgi:hypothetical protein